MPTLKNRRSTSSASGTGGTSASPASARAKENAGNSLLSAESPGSDASPSAAAASTGKRKSRTATGAAISDLDRTADTQAGVEALLDFHGTKPNADSGAEEEKRDDGEEEEEVAEEAEAAESARKKPRRVRGGAKSAKKQKKLHRTASDLLDESDDDEEEYDEEEDDDEVEEAGTKMDNEPASPEPKKRKASSKTSKSKSKSRSDKMPPIASPLSTHNRNDPGKPAEAGVIRRVYVENFMCHRKLTVDLCRNVNFIYGQNGSGKVRLFVVFEFMFLCIRICRTCALQLLWMDPFDFGYVWSCACFCAFLFWDHGAFVMFPLAYI